MDILQWLQLSEIKTGILDVAQALIDDGLVDPKAQAAKLVALSKKVHELENICLLTKN